MDTEQLDESLRASAPVARVIDRVDVRAMMADAAAEVRVPRRRRRNVALGSLLGLLLVGGAGFAGASSDWLWGDGLENPDRSYTYTSPTWGECELRYSGYDMPNPFVRAEVTRIIDDWFASADVVAAADPYVAGYLAELESDGAREAEGANSDPRLPDFNAWMAHDAALNMAMHDVLVEHGYDSSEGDLQGAEAHSQLHCEGEDWGGEGGEQ
jgi:hypothetical protein